MEEVQSHVGLNSMAMLIEQTKETIANLTKNRQLEYVDAAARSLAEAAMEASLTLSAKVVDDFVEAWKGLEEFDLLCNVLREENPEQICLDKFPLVVAVVQELVQVGRASLLPRGGPDM